MPVLVYTYEVTIAHVQYLLTSEVRIIYVRSYLLTSEVIIIYVRSYQVTSEVKIIISIYTTSAFSSLAPSANHLQINQRILSRQKSNGH